MVYTYSDCIKKFKSTYQIEKACKKGELYLLEKGIYSDKEFEDEVAIISTKYSNSVFTMNSAFFYYGFTDTIPDLYYLATDGKARVIKDERVVQKFDNSGLFERGISSLEYDGTKIRIYSKERILVELLRNKSKLSFDYYKEILGNYRDIINTLNIQEITDIIDVMPKKNIIMNAFRTEVL